jgi:hypothetical protein
MTRRTIIKTKIMYIPRADFYAHAPPQLLPPDQMSITLPADNTTDDNEIRLTKPTRTLKKKTFSTMSQPRLTESK